MDEDTFLLHYFGIVQDAEFPILESLGLVRQAQRRAERQAQLVQARAQLVSYLQYRGYYIGNQGPSSFYFDDRKLHFFLAAIKDAKLLIYGLPSYLNGPLLTYEGGDIDAFLKRLPQVLP